MANEVPEAIRVLVAELTSADFTVHATLGRDGWWIAGGVAGAGLNAVRAGRLRLALESKDPRALYFAVNVIQQSPSVPATHFDSVKEALESIASDDPNDACGNMAKYVALALTRRP